MPSKDKHIDPLPNKFKSLEEAAEFWDTHSVTDSEEFLEPVEIDVDIHRRRFEIEVDEECFLAVRERAMKGRKREGQLASAIIRQTPAPGRTHRTCT